MKEKLKQIDKKKLIIVGAFLILIVVILFGGAFIYNKFFYKRSYSEIENIMLTATKEHFAKNKDDLPKSYNEIVTLSDTDLVTIEAMKPISEYLKNDNISCSGSVTVTNIDGKNYRYTPYLDCGESYQTLKFMDYINKAVPIVETGNGLYKLNDELIYRGDNVDNYLKFNGKIYRIVKFIDNSPIIIYTDEKLNSVVWDDRYNIDKNSNLGINDYSVSRVRDSLNELYKGTTLISEENKKLVISHTIYIGKRNNKDTDKTGTLEKSTSIENQFISLLPIYDFLNASTDKNCTTSTSASCSNYNYLAKYNYNWWTATTTSSNTYQVYRISNSATLTSASSNGYLRPVLHLVNDALYVSGTGSKQDPYIIK